MKRFINSSSNLKHPLAIKSWRNNWNEIATFFRYPPEIRRIIYTTNIIEGYFYGQFLSALSSGG